MFRMEADIIIYYRPIHEYRHLELLSPKRKTDEEEPVHEKKETVEQI